MPESKRSLPGDVVRTTHGNSKYVVKRMCTMDQDVLFESRLLGT
jgi:hypothetical protein